jgi:regulatory protein
MRSTKFKAQSSKPEDQRLKAKDQGSEQVRQKTLQRAIKLLAAKPRSVAELRERLLRGRSSSKAAVEAAIAKLSEYGYVDDERFAFGYASLRIQQRPLGRRRLKRDLTLKKVEEPVAEEVLDLIYAETSEAELIDRAIEKRIRIRGKAQSQSEARSLFNHLLRQGFSYELVGEKVRALVNSDPEDTE